MVTKQKNEEKMKKKCSGLQWQSQRAGIEDAARCNRPCSPLQKKDCANNVTQSLMTLLLCKQTGKLTVNLLHVSDEVEHLVRVTDFVVIPRNNLHESVSQSDTGLSVED